MAKPTGKLWKILMLKVQIAPEERRKKKEEEPSDGSFLMICQCCCYALATVSRPATEESEPCEYTQPRSMIPDGQRLSIGHM